MSPEHRFHQSGRRVSATAQPVTNLVGEHAPDGAPDERLLFSGQTNE
jgi:hypothetical protein